MSSAQDKPAYSVKYARDAEVLADVSAATSLTWLSAVGVTMGVVGLLMVIFFLNSGGEPNWPGTVLGLLISVAGTASVNNSAMIQDWRMKRAGLVEPVGATKEELHCEVDVYDDHLEVRGPAGREASYPFSAVSKFHANEDVIVLRCNGESVVIPRSAMSDSRYLNLIDFIDARVK